MTDINNHDDIGRYGNWDPEFDEEVRQLEKIVPVLSTKLWNNGEARHFGAENCLYMLDSLMDLTIDDSEAWREVLSRLSWMSDIHNNVVPEEFEKVLTAIHKAIEGEEDVALPAEDVPQPVRLTVTTTEFESSLGKQEDTQRAAEIIRAARSTR